MDDRGKDRSGAKNRSVNLFALRAAVSAYLVYLGFDLFRAYLVGASTLPPTLAWLCGPGFMAAGLCFGLYSWRRYRRERDAAANQTPPTDEDEKSGAEE